jgi:hypothetical protein
MISSSRPVNAGLTVPAHLDDAGGDGAWLGPRDVGTTWPCDWLNIRIG